jgi:hypothetical protein
MRAAESAISDGSERDVLADTNNLSDVSEREAGPAPAHHRQGSAEGATNARTVRIGFGLHSWVCGTGNSAAEQHSILACCPHFGVASTSVDIAVQP